MARTSLLSPSTIQSSPHPTGNVPFTYTADYINLSRLVSRLQASILPTTLSPSSSLDSPSAPGAVSLQIKASPYHRTRLLTNIEHARTQLLRLEQLAQSIKIQSQKRDVQNQLVQWRDIIRALKAEVEEWGRVYGDAGWYQTSPDEARNGNGKGDATGEGKEDLLAKYGRANRRKTAAAAGRGRDAATSSSTTTESASKSPTSGPSNTALPTSPDSPTPSPSSSLSPQPHPTTTRAYARRRRPTPSTSPSPSSPTATSTGVSSSSTLFSPSNTTSQHPTHDQALASASTTHAALTESLATLSTQLRLSTQSFSNLLTQDTTLLDRASESLEKNVTGMAAAGKRMGVLRRYSEGRGWWGRMILYAWIFGLWLAMVVVVGVGPKFRF